MKQSQSLCAVLIATLALISLSSTVVAAERSSLRDAPGLFRNATAAGPEDNEAFRTAIGLSRQDTLSLLRSRTNARGDTVSRYRQTFRGVPLWGEQIIVKRDARGRLKDLKGTVIRELGRDVSSITPVVSEATARSAMRDRVTSRSGGQPLIFTAEKSELVIWTGEDGVAHLAHAIEFLADTETGGQPTRPTYIVDADTGAVLFELDQLMHAAGCADGCTLLDTTIDGRSGRRYDPWNMQSLSLPADAPANAAVTVTITGGSGDPDLYVKLGSDPTTNSYDCRPYATGSEETCTITADPGDYIGIGIYAYRSYSGVRLTVIVAGGGTEPPVVEPAAGTGPGGNERIGAYEYGVDYGPFNVEASGSSCTMNSTNVKTVDLANGTSGSNAFIYDQLANGADVCWSETDNPTNGAYGALNDAQYFGQVVYDMYEAYLGVPPLTFPLTMRVHYSTDYENAFWDGQAMTFGDGKTTFYPLVSLDVSAHEVSHGFTEQNSNLTYSGQSGGMNEAFSDMAGEAAEFYMRGSNDFNVGADIFKTSDRALRYMCDPTLDGRSIDNAADYYGGMDVHYSSGVYNKTFCTLAKTPGWDTAQAFKAFAWANQNCWLPNSTFVTGAQCVVDEVNDAEGPDRALDVVAAFQVVGIGGLVLPTPPSAPELTISGSNSSSVTLGWTLAANAATYVVERAPEGSSTFVSVSGELSASTLQYTDTGLTELTTYSYRVTGTNAYGSATSNVVAATTSAAPVSELDLTVTTRTSRRGVQTADLAWTGSTAVNIDVYRNATLVATTANTGSYRDKPSGASTYDYYVCEAGTDVCSPVVTAQF